MKKIYNKPELQVVSEESFLMEQLSLTTNPAQKDADVLSRRNWDDEEDDW